MRSNQKKWYVRLGINPKVAPSVTATIDVVINAPDALEAALFAMIAHGTSPQHLQVEGESREVSVIIATDVWNEFGVRQEINYARMRSAHLSPD